MWPFEILARRSKRSSPKTWYWRHRILLIAGPEGWPKASSTSASSTASAVCVDRRERPGGRTQPVVADPARAALLRDQPAQLGVRVGR